MRAISPPARAAHSFDYIQLIKAGVDVLNDGLIFAQKIEGLLGVDLCTERMTGPRLYYHSTTAAVPPCRTCAVVQLRRPVELRLSGSEVLWQVIATRIAPHEPDQTVLTIILEEEFYTLPIGSRYMSSRSTRSRHAEKSVRHMSARSFKSTKKAALNAPGGRNQTPDFDVSNDQGSQTVLTLALEDEDQRERNKEVAWWSDVTRTPDFDPVLRFRPLIVGSLPFPFPKSVRRQQDSLRREADF